MCTIHTGPHQIQPVWPEDEKWDQIDFFVNQTAALAKSDYLYNIARLWNLFHECTGLWNIVFDLSLVNQPSFNPLPKWITKRGPPRIWRVSFPIMQEILGDKASNQKQVGKLRLSILPYLLLRAHFIVNYYFNPTIPPRLSGWHGVCGWVCDAGSEYLISTTNYISLRWIIPRSHINNHKDLNSELSSLCPILYPLQPLTPDCLLTWKC